MNSIHTLTVKKHSNTVNDFVTKLKPYCYWLIPIVLLFVYLPVIAPFGVHNDYTFLENTSRDWWLRYEESWWLYRVGRPIGALLISCQMLLMKNFMSFAYWRLAAVLLGSILSVQFAQILFHRLKYTKMQSSMISLLILVLPATQLSIVWLAMFPIGLIAPSIGLLAYATLPSINEQFTVTNFISTFRKHFLRYILAIFHFEV